MIRLQAFAFVLLSACTLHGQNTPVPTKEAAEEKAVKDDMNRDAQYGYAAPAQDAYQGAWSVNDAQRTAAVWKSLCDARPADVNAQFNWFRSERNARLSSNNGRLLEKDEAELNTIAERINKIGRAHV